MGLYFISGVPGTGKTTLMHELRRRGEEAHDTDIECIRRSRTTGEALTHEQGKAEGYDWIYPTEKLQELKAQALTKNVFLLGSIDNFDEVNEAADEYIWMTVPLNTLVERLDSREKTYGKSDSERQSIIELHKKMEIMEHAKVFKLDATKPVEVIADELLSHIAG